MTETEFGILVGLSQPHVNRIRKGAGTSWPTALRIVRETAGKVTLDDLGYSIEAAE